MQAQRLGDIGSSLKREIFRRRNDRARRTQQRTQYETAGGHEFGRYDARIVALVDQVDATVHQRDLKTHFGILCAIGQQHRRQAAQRERCGGHDAQGARRRHGRMPDRRLDLIEARENLAAPLCIFAPGLGQRDRARRAVQQACLQMGFQQSHISRDGRVRKVKTRGGASKILGLRYAQEYAHRL